MNLLEKLMSIINKQKQAILFSQKDKEIIREISQCNNSYYKTKVLAVLQCELSDWSYDISKYMIKDKNRLIAEKSISVIQEFKRLEDFLNLFEQYQKDEFINYELIEAIGYIGIMRQLDDDIIEKRMKEILQNLEKKGYAKYRIYDYLFYITKNEKYLDAILNGLQSWDDDIRYQALYTVEDVIINEDDNKWLKKINKKLIDNIEKDKRYNRIYRERLINRIRERMGKKKTIICQKEKKLYQRLLLGGKFILQRCVFELYYPVNNDRYEMILELLEKNRTNMMEEQFFIFGSYVESIYGNSEIKFYNENRHSLIGAFTGLAGNLYLNSKLFKYTKKEIYKKHCLQLISKIDKILVYDKMTDIIGGAAGYLLVLCSIFENIEEPQLLVVVKEQMKAVEKILVKRYSANNGGWKLTLEGKEKIYTGFGHGDSGIITALARCDHLLGSTNNREIINEVIRKHKSLFSYENKGWYRTNEKELIGYGWCHGTSGILLSRVLLKKYGYENIDDDIKCAMEISSTRSFGNNTSLCHGDFSSLEIMKLAGKVLYDKKVLEREKLSFHWLYENVMQERYGGKCFRGTEVLGLMLGLSGYVYSLVQHSSNEIPSILYLQ